MFSLGEKNIINLSFAELDQSVLRLITAIKVKVPDCLGAVGAVGLRTYHFLGNSIKCWAQSFHWLPLSILQKVPIHRQVNRESFSIDVFVAGFEPAPFNTTVKYIVH